MILNWTVKMALARRRNKLGVLARRAFVLGAVMLSVAPARADWRTDTGTFRIGVVMQPGETGAPRRFEGFRALAAEALSMPVEIFPARDASALIDAMATSRIEYAVFSALGYATAFELCKCVEPLAAPVSHDGATGVRSALIADTARAARISDLEGMPVAVGPENSLGGDLLPSAGFRWRGKPLADSGFDLVPAETTQESLRLLADGEVAAAFLWEFVRLGSPSAFADGPRAWLDELSPQGFAVLWHSEAIRFGPHAVRRTLASEAKTAMRRMLLGLARDNPVVYDSVSPDLGGGFEAVVADEYRSAAALVTAIGAAEE